MNEEGEETQEAAWEQAGTDPAVKTALQELVKYGYLEEARKPKIYRHALVHQAALLAALEPLDLSLRVDTHRGLALLVVLSSDEEENAEAWSHPLVRRQRLTLSSPYWWPFFGKSFWFTSKSGEWAEVIWWHAREKR